MERNRGAPEPASIDSYEKFSSILETESQTRLVVIDCHQDWCGPTTVMSAYWNQQWLSLESAETRLSLYRLCVNQSGMSDDLIKFISKAGASEGIRLQSQGCKPFFVFLRFGSAVAAVDGVNANGLSMMLDLHLPKVVKKKKDEE